MSGDGMADMIGERIEELIDKGKVSELVDLPGSMFNVFMERLRRRRYLAQGFKVDDTPAGMDTPEG